MAQVVGNQPANAGDIKDTCLIPGSVRSLGGGHGNPLQYSCLENSMDEETGRLHRVTKSQTQLKRLHMHTCIQYIHDMLLPSDIIIKIKFIKEF